MKFASCRGCGAAFKGDGWTGASNTSPRLCRDCEIREREYHGRHAPGVECLAKFLGETRDRNAAAAQAAGAGGTT
jgi:hypothetical protein